MADCRSRSRLTSVIGHFTLQHQDRFRVHSRLLTNAYAADVFIADRRSQNDSPLNSQIGSTETATVLFSKSAK